MENKQELELLTKIRENQLPATAVHIIAVRFVQNMNKQHDARRAIKKLKKKSFKI